MKIEEAYNIIKNHTIINIENEHAKNKGAVGHALEKLLGLKHSSNLLDLEDGEVKHFRYDQKNVVQEDFRITSKWDMEIIKQKLNHLLVVGVEKLTDVEYKILLVKKVQPLKNTFFLEQLEKEVSLIIEKGSINCSQKDTKVFVAKRQNQGRSLYISKAWAHALFHGVYPKGSRKGIDLIPAFELSLK